MAFDSATADISTTPPPPVPDPAAALRCLRHGPALLSRSGAQRLGQRSPTRLNVSPSAVSQNRRTGRDAGRAAVRAPPARHGAQPGRRAAGRPCTPGGALEADRVVSDIEALQGLRRGVVRVCSSGGFAIEFLPRAMALFREQYPGMQFHLRVQTPAAVTQAVLGGEADVGLTYSRAAARDIEVWHRQVSPLVAIMRPDHAAGPACQHHPGPDASPCRPCPRTPHRAPAVRHRLQPPPPGVRAPPGQRPVRDPGAFRAARRRPVAGR
ncbi:SLIT-ROBO Rho GTPase-activating protein 3, partial [Manis javanica]